MKQSDALVLFDIDGTLLLSPDRTHRYALHRAMLDVFGVETTIDGIPYHGKTDPGILRAALQRMGTPDTTIDSRMNDALEVVRRLPIPVGGNDHPGALELGLVLGGGFVRTAQEYEDQR